MTNFSPRRLVSRLFLTASAATLMVSVDVAAGEPSSSSSRPPSPSLPTALWRRGRRMLNFGSLLGSPLKSATPYDRIAGHPVFAITTAWGSPYINNEPNLPELVSTKGADGVVVSGDDENDVRQVCLYFMDPDDAVGLQGEMKQMENLGGADIRITSFSLAKALRQAANLGNGLVTGQGPNPLNGRLAVEEGAALRYKIVPPARQLYYAARCVGRERVGLFADTPGADAQTALGGHAALGAENLLRRAQKQDRRVPPQRTKTPMQQANAHMYGSSGIPVFYAPGLRRVLPWPKRLVSGHRMETPLFFDYEDMVEAWQALRQQSLKNVGDMPETPDKVEVFNAWDVLTSMDRVMFRQRQATPWYHPQNWIVKPIKNRLTGGARTEEAGLEHVTFVPSGRSVHYKEYLSARGNGKARLRPMRAFS